MANRHNERPGAREKAVERGEKASELKLHRVAEGEREKAQGRKAVKSKKLTRQRETELAWGAAIGAEQAVSVYRLEHGRVSKDRSLLGSEISSVLAWTW